MPADSAALMQRWVEKRPSLEVSMTPLQAERGERDKSTKTARRSRTLLIFLASSIGHMTAERKFANSNPCPADSQLWALRVSRKESWERMKSGENSQEGTHK
jgi:hypothetical protein